jgi:hypothetical protein
MVTAEVIDTVAAESWLKIRVRVPTNVPILARTVFVPRAFPNLLSIAFERIEKFANANNWYAQILLHAR